MRSILVTLPALPIIRYPYVLSTPSEDFVQHLPMQFEKQRASQGGDNLHHEPVHPEGRTPALLPPSFPAKGTKEAFAMTANVPQRNKSDLNIVLQRSGSISRLV
jgi:hypothetical protein